MMWHYTDGMGWWMLFGGVWMILFWAALIGVVLWAAGAWQGRPSASKTPLQIAQDRLARGELTLEQYEALREKLA